MRNTAVLIVAAGSVVASLACMGLGGDRLAETPASPPDIVESTAPITLKFGKPSGWQIDKQEYKDGDVDVVHYTLDGEVASVQIVVVEPGATAPDPATDHAAFVQAIRSEFGEAVNLPEVQPQSRTLGGREARGLVQPFSLGTGATPVSGEHQTWSVSGPTTEGLVVIDLTQTDEAARAGVEEVLKLLALP